MGKLFTKDFSIVVIGQIISLFGNAILRFALPLYVLDQTQSASLFGLVLALSAIPMLVLTPVGGIIADRLNKRNIMVGLDTITALVTGVFVVALGHVDLVVLTAVTMMLLAGISGLYQPSVTASVPALADDDHLVAANAVVSAVQNLSQLIGPVAGGILYAFAGIYPVVLVAAASFAISAILELFLVIPHEPRPFLGGIARAVNQDFKDALTFIMKEQRAIYNVIILVMVINVFFTPIFVVGTPVVITRSLGFVPPLSSQLYGYTEGIVALGGVAGAILAGTVFERISIRKIGWFLLFACLPIIPVGAMLFFDIVPMTGYILMTAAWFCVMLLVTVFTIRIITYVQLITPQDLIGKVMALAVTLAGLAIPIGQAILGYVFDFDTSIYPWVFIGLGLICSVIGFFGVTLFSTMDIPDLDEVEGTSRPDTDEGSADQSDVSHAEAIGREANQG